MLKETPDSLKEALDLGISLFAGEAEGRFADVLRDAAAGTLQPIYNYLDDLPNLDGATHPIMPRENVKNTISMISSFDAGRGCPFLCSFCTIINVQGRKSRYRTADDIEEIVRSNQANGVRYFFITDDNLARNRNWEAIFDRLIQLRQEGLNSRFVIQVDTACHKIPRFIEKAAAAGRQARVHRLGKHRSRQSHRGQEEAEPHRRLSRAPARVAQAQVHHLLRLHHRLPGRHAGIGRPPHRDHQARAAGRHPAVLLPHPASRLRGPRQGGRGGRGHRPRPQQVRPRACGLRPSAHDAGRSGRSSITPPSAPITPTTT